MVFWAVGMASAPVESVIELYNRPQQHMLPSLHRRGRMSKQPLILYTFGLLNRYGFGDGDTLSEYADDVLGIYECEYDDGSHEPYSLDEELYDIVQRYLLPALNHKVEITFIHTQHNPVRAIMIDGQDYSSTWSDERAVHEWQEKLTPDYVEISAVQVLSILKEYGYEPFPTGERKDKKDNE
jgi:hypothetical protein